MSKVIKTITDIYQPFAAIVAYKTEDEYNCGYYLEKRDIKDGVMGAGQPLTEELMASLVRNVSASNPQLDKSLYGAVPENVLYCDTRMDKDKLVWYHGPEERNVFFIKSLNIPNGRMKVPGLLYKVEDGTLSIYAFKGKKPKGELYRAPFMNTTENVCLGSAKVAKPAERTFANVIAYWEKMFWQSEFSHLSGQNPIKGNLALLTKRLIETGEPFPTDVLKPVSKKLKEILK